MTLFYNEVPGAPFVLSHLFTDFHDLKMCNILIISHNTKCHKVW